jgi:hypothetical protein
MKPIIVTTIIAVGLLIASCDDESNHFEFYEYTYIDTVLADDTIQNNELTRIVSSFPGGCNRFERIESSERGDTLDLDALYYFYFKGQPCAHDSGLDTTLYELHFSVIGAHYLSYRRSEEMEIVQPIYVEE